MSKASAWVPTSVPATTTSEPELVLRMQRGFACPPDSLPILPPRQPASSSSQPSHPSHPVSSLPQPPLKPKPRKPKARNKILNNQFRPHILAQDRLRLWSSPFSRDHDAEFRKQLPQDVVDKTYAALFGALAPDTQENYAAGLLRFHQFCDKFEISEHARMAASHFLLTAFIAQHIGTVNGGTVKSWMSGIKAWHDLNGAPWEGKDRWRGPVTIEHMIALYTPLDLTKSLDAATWALATAALWGCCRLGELTVSSLDKFDPKYHVTRGTHRRRISPNTTTSATAIPLPWTKSTHDRGGLLSLTGRDNNLCLEKALQNHLDINKDVPIDFHLEWRQLEPHDQRLVHAPLHQHLESGWPPTRVPCKVVAALGGWTSLAFLLYWRKIEHIIPMNVGKAYDKAKMAEVAKVFEEFRIAHNVSLPTANLVL
ncbi:hypothetical protein MVEN_02594800 [Mycena venus]|uniref:DNA breaking-rejoining enzyme n=1 Tax=Mycena venus TaxID=2733690 RepID=A0A8H6TWL6_9AGAR|nr:hypothetical protein MVEN_02594800 [Mycena venus]